MVIRRGWSTCTGVGRGERPLPWLAADPPEGGSVEGESSVPPHVAPLDDPGCEALAANGAVVRLRTIRPSDADGLRALNARSSDHSLYLRFFGSSRISADRYVDRLVRPAGEDHGVLVALLGDVLVGVAGYERVADHEAEVALLVEDVHQGEGIGMLLLEHLASLARRHGIVRLVADTLAQNFRMLGVFDHSGFETDHIVRAGVVDIGLVTAPDLPGFDAIDERERRAELRSLGPMFAPRAVAVVGSLGAPGEAGREVVRSLVRGGFRGPIYPVDPQVASIAGWPAFPSVQSLPRPVDLAVVAAPVGSVDAIVDDCGSHGVRVVSVLTGYPPAVEDSQAAPSRRSLLHAARRHGIRVVGPGCLGVVNTDPAVRLDASVAAQTPSPGGIALAAQAGAVGLAVLELAAESGAGIASFVSLGDKIDISGNDLLLVWDRDPRVTVVALYLESLGNPRKFARLARRVARFKPVVLLKLGPAAGETRPGPRPDPPADDVMIDVLCEQAGIARVDTIEELVDLANAFARCPLPAGGRVGIVTNDHEVRARARADVLLAGLEVPDVSTVDPGAPAGAEQLAPAVRALAGSGEVDAVLAIWTSSPPPRSALMVLDEIAKTSTITVLAVLPGAHPVRPTGDGRAGLPIFGSAAAAIRTLAKTVTYGRWLRTGPGRMFEVSRDQVDRAREMISAYLARSPGGGSLGRDQAKLLLACYGIDAVRGVGESVAELIVAVAVHPSFGPILTLRHAGVVEVAAVARSCRAAPVSDSEARRLVLGLGMTDIVDLSQIESLLQRVGRLAADHPEVAELELNPVLVGAEGALTTGVRLRLAPPADSPDPDLRRLRA